MAGGVSSTHSQARWEAHRRAFEEYLQGLRFTEEARLRGLEEAMRYSMLAGGKRVRPALCMEVAWIFGAEPSLVLPSAAAIELIHTYSLIHDDLPAMDDDDYRRGMPTAHKKFGEAMAILAGDAFFGEALTLITVHQKGACDQILDVVRELAGSTGVNGMVGGQGAFGRRLRPRRRPPRSRRVRRQGPRLPRHTQRRYLGVAGPRPLRTPQ